MAQVHPKSFRELNEQGIQPGGIGKKTQKPSFPSGGEPNTTEESPAVVAKSKGPGELVFPRNLSSIDHFMSFDVFDHTFRRKTEPTKDEIKCSIKLPLSEDLSQDNKQAYASEGLGTLGKAGAELGAGAARAVASGSPVTSVLDDLSNIQGSTLRQGAVSLGVEFLAGDAGASTVLGGALGGAGGALTGAAAQPIFKGAFAGAGIARNPYQAVFYNNPEFRTFDYTWKLYPEDETEQETLHTIINNFRYYSSPGLAYGEVFFTYPQMFDITFAHPEYTFNPGPCVCTSVSTNYHPDGPLYHRLSDGSKAPVGVELKLAFQEVNILTKADIKAGR